MSHPGSVLPVAGRVRKLLVAAFVVGFIGAVIAIAAGSRVDEPFGRFGVALVLGALLVGIVLTPLGVVLNILAMRYRARQARRVVGDLFTAGDTENSPDISRKDGHE